MLPEQERAMHQTDNAHSTITNSIDFTCRYINSYNDGGLMYFGRQCIAARAECHNCCNRWTFYLGKDPSTALTQSSCRRLVAGFGSPTAGMYSIVRVVSCSHTPARMLQTLNFDGGGAGCQIANKPRRRKHRLIHQRLWPSGTPEYLKHRDTKLDSPLRSSWRRAGSPRMS